MSADRDRKICAGSIDQNNLARRSDSAIDAVIVVSSQQSSQVATSSIVTTEEPTIVQTTSANQLPTQLTQLDTGNFPESVIQQTDLA